MKRNNSSKIEEIIDEQNTSNTSEDNIQLIEQKDLPDLETPKPVEKTEIKVLIGVITHDRKLAIETVSKMLDTQKYFQVYNLYDMNTDKTPRTKKITVEWNFLGGKSERSEMKNMLLSRAVGLDQTYVMFVDPDVEWEPETILKLVELAQSEKLTMVGVASTESSYKWDNLKEFAVQGILQLTDIPSILNGYRFKALNNTDDLVANEKNLLEVKSVDLCFTLIDCKALAAVMRHHTSRKYNILAGNEDINKNLYMLFGSEPAKITENSVEKKIYFHGDELFCYNWRSAGQKIHIYTAGRIARPIMEPAVSVLNDSLACYDVMSAHLRKKSEEKKAQLPVPPAPKPQETAPQQTKEKPTVTQPAKQTGKKKNNNKK
jgi:hypothetical protein